MENIIHYYAKCIELLQEEKYKKGKTEKLLIEFKNHILKYQDAKKENKKIETETVTMSLERYEHMKDHMEDLYKDNNILKNNINYFALKQKYNKIPKWIRNLFN